MDLNEVLDLLRNEKKPVITVFGDFCLDKYLYVDAKKDELSLETNLTAYQITHRKLYAGAGGTITNNLRALGATVYCIGIVGNDGEGYELMNCLQNVGADTSLMVHTGERSTCTYVKPMRCQNGDETEMNRYDIKNFTPTPMHIQKQLIYNLQKVIHSSDAIIICDQYMEANCAAVTEYIQNSLSNLAKEYTKIIWYADSRRYIDKFRNIIIKCNHNEIARIFNLNADTVDADTALVYSKKLYEVNGKPVYITLGKNGSTVYDGVGHKVPAFSVKGQVDIVGAGDACNAGIVFALTKGANFEQAALVGNAASSLVIQTIGETGAAQFDDVIRVLNKVNTIGYRSKGQF